MRKEAFCFLVVGLMVGLAGCDQSGVQSQGSDGSAVDLAGSDQVLPDLAAPDLVQPDLYMPDLAVCATGSALCGGDCADLQTDPNYCGHCDTACTTPANATATCAKGVCGYTCNANFTDCGNGLCADLQTDQDHCGACGTACMTANGAPACQDGQCAVAMCNTGFGDCNMTAADGCEANLQTNLDHCGDCEHICSQVDNGTASCQDGMCGYSCAVGFTNCGNGVCADLQTDPKNCNACGDACAVPANSTATCTKGVCDILCDANFSLCGSTCANLQTDADNCGTCGHGCAGGACEMGVCQPVVIGKSTEPYAIAVDANNVYWTSLDGTIDKAPTSLGTTTVLATDQGTPYDIALTASSVYWSSFDQGAIRYVAKTGGVSRAFVTGQNKPDGLFIDSTGRDVFWTNQGSGTVLFQLVVGSTNALIANRQNAPIDVTMFGGVVYWLNADAVYREHLPDTPNLMAMGGNPQRLAIITTGPAAGLVWTDAQSNTIQKFTFSTNIHGRLAVTKSQPFGIATDGKYVYWTTVAGGTVAKISINGGTMPTVLATGQDQPHGIAVDGTSVYWANTGSGTVMKIAK